MVVRLPGSVIRSSILHSLTLTSCRLEFLQFRLFVPSFLRSPLLAEFFFLFAEKGLTSKCHPWLMHEPHAEDFHSGEEATITLREEEDDDDDDCNTCSMRKDETKVKKRRQQQNYLIEKFCATKEKSLNFNLFLRWHVHK